VQLKKKKLLYDILISINSIEEFIADITSIQDYQKNKLVRRAVEREIEIIGEAVNKITKIDPSLEITNARKIVNTRNWVIHAYDSVDDIIIWGIVTKHLPYLKHEVEEIFNNL
jgi:uncharacterized protein with HEPN domain